MASKLRYLAMALPLALIGCGGSSASVGTATNNIDFYLYGGWYTPNYYSTIAGHYNFDRGHASYVDDVDGHRKLQLSYNFENSEETRFQVNLNLPPNQVISQPAVYSFNQASSSDGTFNLVLAMQGENTYYPPENLNQANGTLTILSVAPQNDGSNKLTFQIEISSTAAWATVTGQGEVYVR